MPSITEIVGQNNILKRGSSDREAITALQTALRSLGYPIDIDGYFGGETETACIAFQQLCELEADGEVGPNTAAAIDHALGGIDKVVSKPAAVEAPPGRPLWLVAALSWAGTAEQPGDRANNPIILQWAKDQGGSTAQNYTHDSIPWCALFANAVLQQVGLKGTGTLWALDFTKWGQKIEGPAVGAFAPMKRDGGGHITIVVGRDQYGNLMCCGGNQSDKVTVTAFDPDRVVSWRWPGAVEPPASVGFRGLPLVSSDGRVSRNEA